MAPDEIFSFWLMPAAREREFFAGVIAELAARFDAPVFEPHVTLAGGKADESGVTGILERIQHSPALELEIERVAFSALFTKTLFVQFHPSTEATALSESLREAAGFGTEYEFDPHLSLLYSDITDAEKESLGATITIPFQRVRFDRVKAISTRVPITTRKEIDELATARRMRPTE
jgi:2'-5' RNA ligase